MIKQTITYKDFSGKERTEDFYFNLSKSELVEMVAMSKEDLVEKLRRIVAANDGGQIMETVKEFMSKAYGEKSEDGRRLVKGPELFKAFTETPAYDQLFMRLVTEPDFLAIFINGIVPQDLETK